MSLLDLATTLWRRNGGPHRYWRVGTRVDDKSEWERMRVGGFAAVGWAAIGDLSDVPHDQAGKQEIRKRIEENDPGNSGAMTRAANQLFQFVTAANERDLILAMQGAKVRGIGKVSGAYFFQPNDGPCPHRRAVEWLRVGDWLLPEQEGMQTRESEPQLSAVQVARRVTSESRQCPREKSGV